MSIIGSGANQLVVHGHLGSVAYFDVKDLPASSATQVAIDAAIAGLATVARTGSYDDLTDKVPLATEQELAEGTETAPRIYAPKTFYDAAAFVAHNIANPLNLNTGNNFTISITANSTLANPTGAKSGQTGTLHVAHDENLTLSFGSAWKFIGGVPELPNTAGQAVITYQVVDTTNILATFGEIE